MRNTMLLIGLCLGIVATAQPKWSKKARKSLVEVVTRDKDGLVLQRRAGFIASDDGRVLTTYDQLPAAASIEVVADGKNYQAMRVVSADAMMDYCLFTTGIRKPVALPAAAVDAGKGREVFVLTATSCAADTVAAIETVKEHPYYTLSAAASQLGAPLLNDEGEVLGMVHAADDKGAYAVSIGTVNAARPSAIAAAGRSYAELPVPILLPEDEDQARTFVFLSQKCDSSRYMAHVDDFIKAYPSATFGYTAKGEYLIQHLDTAAAAAVYDEGMKAVDSRDELYYSQSSALYHQALNLNRALSLCDDAIKANPLPLYSNHRALVLYSLQRYGEAAEGFEAVAKTNMRSAQTFVYASQSRRMAGDSVAVCLALLDSAVACYSKPYPAEAATTILLRATTRAEAAQWRQAVTDYNEYEHLCAGRVNAEFYFRRFIAEANGRMYQHALDDLDRAINLAPDEAELHAQKALLLYRLGQKEEALPPARRAIEIDAAWKEELGVVLGN